MRLLKRPLARPGTSHLLTFLLLLLPTAYGMDCTFPDIDMCRESGTHGGTCNCPCLPKCCPVDQHLIRQSNPQKRGFACSSNELDSLPSEPPPVRLRGKLKESRAGKVLKFYESTLPTCVGIEEKIEESSRRWSYKLHNDFEIHADFESEYILHINGPDNGDISSIIGNRHQGNSSSKSFIGFPSYDPLTSFCVDYFYSNGSFSSSALTCPKFDSKPNKTAQHSIPNKIRKCCPPGSIFQHSNLERCSKVVNQTAHWRLPINGYLQHMDDMIRSNNLIYSEEYSLNGIKEVCGDETKVQSESDIFLIGEDGHLYYTDTYEDKVNPAAAFCVEQIFIHGIDPKDYEYSYDYEEDYDDPESATFIETCHHKHPKPHQMIIFYCQDPVIQIRKCCSKGENLNVRAQACTSDMASQTMTTPTVYSMNNRDPVSEDRILNIIEMNLRNLQADELAVSVDPFYFREDRTLLYNGVRYRENQFCLDYVIDYCGNTPSMSLKAIIADKSLIHNKVGTIFGSSRLDSIWSRNFKRVGFTISSISLVIVIFIFVIVKELRQDLHGKMVLCIVSSLLIVYLGLLSATFQDSSFRFISKTNGWCVAQGSITYFFIMSTFGWMSAMSYNIMTKFRVRTILPRGVEGIRFMTYALFSFGPAVILLTCVLIFQSKSDASWYRPGIGEESCWFTSCSSGLTIFLYIPITCFLIFNLVMFTFSAIKLRKLSVQIQKKIKAPAEETTESSTPGNRISNMRESVRAVLNRQFSRNTSNKQRRTYIANKEVFLTYLKLFCAMGQNWILEVLAWFFTTSEDSLGWVQYLLNFLNMLQGLVMFFVFVFKPTTFKELRKYFGSCGKKSKKKATVERKASVNVGDSWGGYDNPEKRLTFSSTGIRSMDAVELDTSCMDVSDVQLKPLDEESPLKELSTLNEDDEAANN